MTCNCKNCGASFTCVKRGNNHKKYCSTKCRREYWKNKESMAANGGGGDSITQSLGESVLKRGLRPVAAGIASSSGLGVVGVIGTGIAADVFEPKIREGIKNGNLKPVGTFGGAAIGYHFTKNKPWYFTLPSSLIGAYLGNGLEKELRKIFSPPSLPAPPMAANGGGGGGGELTRKIMSGLDEIRVSKNDKTADDILNTKYKSYDMKGDYFGLIFGYKPADPFHAIAYGKPGSGKSTLSMQYANYFSSKFGVVKFLSSEMKEGDGLKNLLERTKTNGKNIVFDTAPYNTNVEDHIKRLKKANVKLLIIDSANHLRWSPDDLERIKESLPQLSTFVILQSVKQGDFRGHNDYVHNADVVVKIDNFEVFTEKSRFQRESIAGVQINL